MKAGRALQDGGAQRRQYITTSIAAKPLFQPSRSDRTGETYKAVKKFDPYSGFAAVGQPYSRFAAVGQQEAELPARQFAERTARHQQFDTFCTNIYAEGFQDGRESVKGAELGKILDAIRAVKRIAAFGGCRMAATPLLTSRRKATARLPNSGALPRHTGDRGKEDGADRTGG